MSKLKVRVNRSKPESMTRQITDQIAGLINTGVLAAGEMLPSERMLADSLGVARNVVRRSYDYLMSGELIEGQGRRGRRVRASASGRSPSASSSGRKRSAADKSTKRSSTGKGGKKTGKASAKGRAGKGR